MRKNIFKNGFKVIKGYYAFKYNFECSTSNRGLAASYSVVVQKNCFK